MYDIFKSLIELNPCKTAYLTANGWVFPAHPTPLEACPVTGPRKTIDQIIIKS